MYQYSEFCKANTYPLIDYRYRCTGTVIPIILRICWQADCRFVASLMLCLWPNSFGVHSSLVVDAIDHNSNYQVPKVIETYYHDALQRQQGPIEEGAHMYELRCQDGSAQPSVGGLLTVANVPELPSPCLIAFHSLAASSSPPQTATSASIRSITSLKDTLYAQIAEKQKTLNSLKKEHGDQVYVSRWTRRAFHRLACRDRDTDTSFANTASHLIYILGSAQSQLINSLAELVPSSACSGKRPTLTLPKGSASEASLFLNAKLCSPHTQGKQGMASLSWSPSSGCSLHRKFRPRNK